MTGAGRLAAAALLLLALTVPVSAAHGAVIMDDADQAELAQALADATDEQDVCYGWRVDVQDDGSGPSGTDMGSGAGPGVPLDKTRCAKWVELTGNIHFTSDWSESEDDSSAKVETNIPGGPATSDLDDLGFSMGGWTSSGPLTGDDNDTVLMNMVEALPLIVAEKGAASYVDFETSDEPSSVQGQPTDKPGSDALRQRWPAVVFAGVLILAGLCWLIAKAMGVFDDPYRRRYY